MFSLYRKYHQVFQGISISYEWRVFRRLSGKCKRKRHARQGQRLSAWLADALTDCLKERVSGRVGRELCYKLNAK